MKTIPETDIRSPDTFREVILTASEPVVFRGLVADWPIVEAARRSERDLTDYMRRFDRGRRLNTMMAPPEARGRFFYDDDIGGFNYQQGGSRLGPALDFLLNASGDENAPSMAIQSVTVRENLPGFEQAHPMPLLDKPVEPRIWIGNRAVVAAHHDHSENIACSVAGKRRFTLFPPNQVGNLYQGPFELTPAYTTISMVDFRNPDFETYPRFREALEHAQVADLEPGDAIYVPYLWWHHVEALDNINILVNYWWDTEGQDYGQPREALLHALMVMKDLPPAKRAAWQAMFEHYVFAEDGPPGQHLPENRRGIMGELTDENIRSIRTGLARTLMSPLD